MVWKYKKHKKWGFELGFRYDNFLPNQSQTNDTNMKDKNTHDFYTDSLLTKLGQSNCQSDFAFSLDLNPLINQIINLKTNCQWVLMATDQLSPSRKKSKDQLSMTSRGYRLTLVPQGIYIKLKYKDMCFLFVVVCHSFIGFSHNSFILFK